MLTYILEVSICWGVFYLLYALLLSKETFFHFNRWYLLSTFVLSLAIPKVEWRLPEPVAESEIATVYFQPITVGMETLEVTVTATPVASGVDFMDVLRWIYLAGVAFFTLRFFIGLWQITRLYRHSERRWTTFYELVLSQKIHQPFSFFDRLFMSKLIPLTPEEEKQIVQHELAHIRGLHSVDVILLEIVGILFWCTPLVYYYRKSLCNVHEYIADAVVLRTNKKKQYGHLLIRQSQSGPQVALANHFHSQLKKRILMMMRNKSKRQAMLKYLLAIPLTLGVMLLFSNADAQESLQKQAEALEEAFTGIGETIKITNENGTLTLKAEEGISLVGDTIPLSTESAKPFSGNPTYEIHYPDGTIKTTTSSVQIGDEIDPNEIEKIEVFREPESLVKIWLKKENTTLGEKSDEIFKVVDEMPLFPAACPDATNSQELKRCSDKAMLEFIYKNIKYPAAARNAKTEGMVVVSFVVEKDGTISTPKVLREIGNGCGDEAVRVVKLMEEQNMRWTPGKQNGKAVRVQFNLPVRYKLDNTEQATPEKNQIDTVFTFNPETYEETMTTVDHSKNKVTVVGYGDKNTSAMNDEVFKVVEQMPRFPAACPDATNDAERKHCADRAMLEFIYKNIQYPKVARDAGTEGMVVVSFIVEKDGSISGSKMVRDIGNGCGVEALRVVDLMQVQNIRWAPGKENGKAVRVQFNLPIRFKLEPKEAPQTDAKAAFVPPAPDFVLQLKDFRATPNPTKGLLNVSFRADAKPTTVRIIDATGKEVHAETLQNFPGNYQEMFNFDNLPKGMLYIIVTQDKQGFVSKVVLQ